LINIFKLTIRVSFDIDIQVKSLRLICHEGRGRSIFFKKYIFEGFRESGSKKMIKEGNMRKLLLVSLLFVMVLGSSTVFAADKAPLGAGNLALKVDYIHFTESFLEDADVDNGLYVGVEAYSELADIAPNFYIGMEVGYTNPQGDLSGNVFVPGIGIVHIDADTETTFVPIELNLKYAIKASPYLVIDIGAGASLNYATAEISVPDYDISVDDDDWLWGGQIFADLNYKINQFFIGINAKYQITEDYEIEDFETDVSGKNWRIGGQAGIMF
jgi:hypothetical protein